MEQPTRLAMLAALEALTDENASQGAQDLARWAFGRMIEHLFPHTDVVSAVPSGSFKRHGIYETLGV